jgi:lipopolysaccharide biosynthesis regulator YciM
MKKAYFETSSINHAHKSELKGSDISISLKAQGLIPTIGLHTIYELAKTFLDKKQKEKAQGLFVFLRDLEPTFMPSTWDLLSQEVLKLRTGAAVLPFLSTNNQHAAKIEINRLASGTFDKHAEDFIRSREEKIKKELPEASRAYLDQISRVAAQDKKRSRRLKTFEDVLSYFAPKLPEIIIKILKGYVSMSEAQEMAQRLNSFPALRSTLRTNLYLSFIHISHRVSPAKDRTDDLRHIIDASYTEIIIIGDSQLLKLVNCINPDLQALPWNDFIESVRN